MRRQDKEERKFSSQAEEIVFGLYQNVARMFMETNTKKKDDEPTYSEPSEFKFSPDTRKLVVEYEDMYDRPTITFAFLESLSEAFETKYINIEDGHSNRGCETCDFGSSYGVVITLKNIGIDFGQRPTPKGAGL